MKPENLNNIIDNHEELLERAVEMIEEGHQLTDDEMALLTGDKEAAEVYRQLTTLRDVVASPNPISAATPTRLSEGMEEVALAPHLSPLSDEEDAEPNASRFGNIGSGIWLLAAAAILLALIISYPKLLRRNDTADGLMMVYEHIERPDDIILKTDKGGAVAIDGAKKVARAPKARLTSNQGQLVLDYQTLQQQGYAVSTEVETNTVEVPCGKDFKLVLADGTEVWLNADSRLIYPSHFVEAERRVYLEGEAYFRVAKDSEHPFVIATDQMEARVLGTELNVSCRDDGSTPHVALVTGSVEVNTKGKQHALLRPGLGASLVGQDLVVAFEDMEPYVYWRKGYVYFDDATLTEIAHSLGRWFNVDVSMSNEQLGNIHMHFLYKRGDSLRRVVSILNGFRKFRVEMRGGRTLAILPIGVEELRREGVKEGGS
ncbi:MAG: FecR family protein [Prevotella sp.]|nr:FecR family protein [Prevotella sp.]